MESLGSVLIADDEETFREATSRLLAREGFGCHCAQDTEEAVECLRRSRFDLLVADIRMPRNPDLRVVRKARELDSEMAIILVTGYPSMQTAIRSVEMSIMAYLTKPVSFEELARHVRTAVRRSRKRRTLSAVAERLGSVMTDLETARSKPLPRDEETDEISLDTVRTLAACLSQTLELSARSARDRGLGNLCELLDCPQKAAHRQAILESIDVLKKTKDTFKSKALAELRTKLEHVVGVS